MTNIGKVMRLYRRVNDIEQKALADEIGIHPSTLSNVEAGKHTNQETLIRLINWLFGDGQNDKQIDMFEPNVSGENNEDK